MHWVIGDIHGMNQQLNAVLKEIKRQDKDPQFWFVGDYCDRGPDSFGVVETILGLGDKAHPIRGNHDDIMDCICRRGPTPYSDAQHSDAHIESMTWFLKFGMVETLNSYGVTIDEIREATRSKHGFTTLLDKIPQTHKDFYKNLPLYREADDFFICHAYCPKDSEGGPAEIIDYACWRRAMMWDRFDIDQINNHKDWRKTGYFGHTPTVNYGLESGPTIIRGPKIVLVDTGGAFKDGGGLTAVCHKTGTVVNCGRTAKKAKTLK